MPVAGAGVVATSTLGVPEWLAMPPVGASGIEAAGVALLAVPLAPLVAGVSTALAAGASATTSGFTGQSSQANNATTSRPPPAPNPISSPRFEPDDIFPFFDPLPRAVDFSPPRVFCSISADSSAKSSSTNSSDAGTSSGFWHAGHLTLRPAKSSLTESDFPHGHFTWIAILMFSTQKSTRHSRYHSIEEYQILGLITTVQQKTVGDNDSNGRSVAGWLCDAPPKICRMNRTGSERGASHVGCGPEAGLGTVRARTKRVPRAAEESSNMNLPGESPFALRKDVLSRSERRL